MRGRLTGGAPRLAVLNWFMAKAQRKRSSENRYVWRDSDSGRFVDVVVADPAVRPKTVTVEKIRKAVREVTSARSDRKRSDRPSRKER